MTNASKYLCCILFGIAASQLYHIETLRGFLAFCAAGLLFNIFLWRNNS